MQDGKNVSMVKERRTVKKTVQTSPWQRKRSELSLIFVVALSLVVQKLGSSDKCCKKVLGSITCDEEFGEDDDEFAVVVGVGCKKCANCIILI